MIFNIRRKLALLLITLLTLTTASFASTLGGIEQDSIVSITHSELKETNLIFLEHRKLLTDNKLLNDMIKNYELSSRITSRIDSLRNQQLSEYTKLYKESLIREEQLTNQLTKKSRILSVWKIGGISVSASLLLLFFLK